MTETELRQKVANIMNGWINNVGKGGAQHLDILNTYNTYKPLACGYKVQVTDAYCATTVSAAWIKAGIASYTGTECSCPRFVEIAKKKGYWTENDAYNPKVGDAVLYDWQDSGSGDNKGVPDHIGIVTQAGKNQFVVTEGNMNGGKVGKRTMTVNGRYIRGFITPNYAAIAKAIGGTGSNETDTNPYSTEESVKPQKEEPVTPVTVVVSTDNEKAIASYLQTELGLNVAATCGVLANIEKESNFRTDPAGDNGTSYGICQWHLTRFTNLKTWCANNKKDYKSLDGQLGFLKHELTTAYKAVYSYLKEVPNTAQGAYDAGYRWCLRFEVPYDTINTSKARGNDAKNNYWPKYSANMTTTAATTASSRKTYKVQAGDNLTVIAKKNGIDYDTLLKLNPQIKNPNVIYIGQVVYLSE